MSDLDWDDDDFEVPAIIPAGSAATGAEDEEELPPEESGVTVQTGPKEPTRKKNNLKSKIAEKEAAEVDAQERRRRAAAALRGDAPLQGQGAGLVDALEDKLHRQKLVEEADFENARDMFGEQGSTAVSTGVNLSDLTPKSKAEFAKAADLFGRKISQFKMSPFYLDFVKELIRTSCGDMDVDDIKEVDKTVTVIVNEKVKQMQPKKKKKKKDEKKSVRVDAGGDMAAYDNLDGLYDDFM